ncbi:hypothetical protein [Actinacidiphila acididurans]|uniref:Uncharacterized protein n=1 Tax=Actinacidiphila acididurans TaxID=2784346 RepID=A0ABS2TNA4_9ACTN|nr:hypothetical protein [Actinacidiphila acididurans]MBM9504819.1 hypothetical protein [Actinacidiphila acididurans]
MSLAQQMRIRQAVAEPNVLDSHGALYQQLKHALKDLAQAREMAAVGEDAVRAVELLRGLVRLVKQSSNGMADPHWQMAELILDSVPSADTHTPASTRGGTR